MIKSFTIINHLGESINLDIRRPEQSGFLITSVAGLTPTNATINTTDNSYSDGTLINSVKKEQRNIVFNITFVDTENKESIETVRQKCYKYFQVAHKITILVDTDYRTYKIKGVVETNEIDIFSQQEGSQISIICPDPYFNSLTYNSLMMAAIQPRFKFPFKIQTQFKFAERRMSVIDNFINDSSVEVYPIIEFLAKTELTNPSIMNINTYEKAKINITLTAGDKVVIDTRKGQKSIILYSGNILANIFNYKDSSFRFFKLHVGDNYLKYDADINPTGLQTTVKWESLYGGV